MRTLLMLICAAALIATPAWADKVETSTDDWITAGTVAALPPGTPWETAPTSTVTVRDFTFEFEQFETDRFYFDGEVAEATISSAIGDIILQITRPGSIFKFTNLSPYSEGAGLPGGVPDEWGSRSLDPFVDETNPAGWVMTAIVPLGYAVLNTSAQLGDFSPSDKDELTWDGEPGVLNNNAGEPLAVDPFAWLQAGGIGNSWGVQFGQPMPDNTYTFGGGGGGPDQPMSLFWDNIVVSVVARATRMTLRKTETNSRPPPATWPATMHRRPSGSR